MGRYSRADSAAQGTEGQAETGVVTSDEKDTHGLCGKGSASMILNISKEDPRRSVQARLRLVATLPATELLQGSIETASSDASAHR